MTKISVIIPVLNEAPFLKRLLPYIQECDTHNEIEIILVDAKSDDDSSQIALSAGVKVLQSSFRCRAHQMNLGAEMAKSDILYFVHADVLPPKDFISKLLKADENGIQLAFFRQKFDKKSIFLSINAFFTRFKKTWCRGGDQTVFVKKSLFNAMNGFDESFIIMEEYDFIRRAKTFCNFEVLNGDTLVSSRKYSTNSWLRVMLANYTAIRAFKKGVPPNEIKDTYTSMLNPY